MKDDVKERTLEEVGPLPRKMEIPQNQEESVEVEQQQGTQWTSWEEDDWVTHNDSEEEGRIDVEKADETKCQLPTPPTSPPAALLAASMYGSAVVADPRVAQ